MIPPVKKTQPGQRLIAARKFLAGKKTVGFRRRGGEITRMEALSDAVFAFSISLLIMSLEVPQTFKELKQILQSFLPFVATVCLVLLFWYQQDRFFRNYGLNDLTVVVLNIGLLLMVLFYVYPLKFLFSLLFSMILPTDFFPKATAQGEVVLTQLEFPQLVMIYSAGYAAIWFIFFLLYLHAFRRRRHLQLSAFEVEDTRRQLSGALIDLSVGVLSTLLAWADLPALGGLCFLLLAPALLLNNRVFQQRMKRKGLVTKRVES